MSWPLYFQIDLLKLGLTAAMLGSANLGSSAFLVFYYNFAKRRPAATKFCTHSATDNMNKCCKFGYSMISIFFVCAYIVDKWYVGVFSCAKLI